MIRLAAVIDTFETAFLAQYRHRLTSDHYRALAAMKQCRTEASPKMQVQCSECAQQKLVPHSCGHRHCPHCQHHESQQWLERQLKKQVPAEYFLLTFTLPAEFRPLAFAPPRLLYDGLMRCAWETVQTFSHNDKQLQGTPGAIAVLHTHTRKLDYHPHVHLVMPAAAVNREKRQWRTKRRGKGNCKRLITLLHLLLRFAPGRATAWVKQRAPILCACCGAVMVIARTRIRSVFARPLPVPIVIRGAQ